MTERRTDEAFYKKKKRWVIYFVIACSLFVLAGFRIEIRDALFFTVVVSLVTFLIATYALDDFMRDIYRCPQCGKILYPRRGVKKPRLEEGDAITFLCENCDVEWATGEEYSVN